MKALLSRWQNSPSVIMAVMILVITTAAIETDIFVPSFPDLKVYFATNETMIQLIIGINFLGLCFSSLIYGPMTDSYGRRCTLLIGTSLFLLASIGCILAQRIETLLFWRFIQGLGASAAFIVPAAVIFDIYSKEHAAKLLGLTSAVITFAMSLAPIIGNYLNKQLGWQSNFILVGLLSLITFLLTLFLVKETLTPDKKMPIHYKSIATNYLKLLYSKETVWYLILICCVCAGYIIYITNLSLIFVDYMGVDADHYTYYQGSVLLIYAIMSYFSGRIIQFLGINIARITGLSINLVGGGTLFAVALLFTENPLLITIAMCVYAAGFALCSGIIFSDFMHAFSEIKGLASAMCNFARLLFMALMIGLSGVLFNGTIIPVASMIAVFCLISLVCILFMPRIQPASETAEPAQSVNEV